MFYLEHLAQKLGEQPRNMENYLAKVLDWKQDDVTNQIDELPLWSSPFGLLLMDNFPIGDYKNYLDVGCGTGFPLIDISQRLGNSCNAYGMDPWKAAMKRTKTKIETIGLKNINLIEGDASIIPFPDDYFDLITSNLGINNFENPLAVLSECCRVIKTGASLCTTTNLTGTFNEFYDIFAQTLIELGFSRYASKLEEHVKHRGSIESKCSLIEKAGFRISKRIEAKYHMRFLNGSAFLNHSLIIVGFIDPWRNMFDDMDKQIFFYRFENNLNEFSKKNGELKLSIPMLYIECKK